MTMQNQILLFCKKVLNQKMLCSNYQVMCKTFNQNNNVSAY